MRESMRMMPPAWDFTSCRAELTGTCKQGGGGRHEGTARVVGRKGAARMEVAQGAEATRDGSVGRVCSSLAPARLVRGSRLGLMGRRKGRSK